MIGIPTIVAAEGDGDNGRGCESFAVRGEGILHLGIALAV